MACRIIVDSDPSTLKAKDLEQFNTALNILRTLAQERLITVTTKRTHADRGIKVSSGLMPQTQRVLDYLKTNFSKVDFTVATIAPGLGLSDLSARSQLHELLKHGLVQRQEGQFRSGRRPVTGWSLTAQS